MVVKKVAILSPGDMGHAVGRVLIAHDIDVVSFLEGRSERTKELSRAAGIREQATLEKLVIESDFILSIVVPSQAQKVARLVADAIQATHTETYYIDCNPIPPHKAIELDQIITSAGGCFIDASIIGAPPKEGSVPRFYASGQYAKELSVLDGMGVQICPMEGGVGRASALKMCYAALGKGTHALYIALLAAADVLGVYTELVDELLSTNPEAYKRMEADIPRLPVKARRWVAEMENISVTFAQTGLPSGFHLGAAEIYRILGMTPFGDESPETLDRSRTLVQTIEAFVRCLGEKPATLAS